ncbi:MAG: hypothetical protein IPP40_06175 [bacterium]|nr:hypothetical protein [bacterium]
MKVVRLDNNGNTVWSHPHWPAYELLSVLYHLTDGRYMGFGSFECDSAGRILWGELPNGVPFSGSSGSLYTINLTEIEDIDVTTLRYYGQGFAEPQLFIEPDRLDFGTIVPNEDTTLSLVVHNAGTLPLLVSDISVDPPFFIDAAFPLSFK